MSHAEDPQVLGLPEKKKKFLVTATSCPWFVHPCPRYQHVLKGESHKSLLKNTEREALREIEQMENGEKEREGKFQSTNDKLQLFRRMEF